MPARPRLARVLVVSAFAAALTSVGAGAQVPAPEPGEPEQTNPCRVAGNDLACPDLIMRPPYDLSLEKKNGRRLLRSTNAIVNVGRGPLEIRGRRTTDLGGFDMPARQAIRTPGGKLGLLRQPDGNVHFTPIPGQGRYWKFEDAANFELYRLDADGRKVELVATSPKIFYCFRDLKKVRSTTRTPREFVYPACSQRGPIRAVTLGTSVGWADIYPAGYDRNWIDVTGLSGCFAYVHIADPEQHLAEEREDNNSAQTGVRLPWQGPGRGSCPRLKLGPPELP